MLNKIWDNLESEGIVHVPSFISKEIILQARDECIRLKKMINNNLEVEYEPSYTSSETTVRKIRRVFWQNEIFWTFFLQQSGIAELVKDKIGEGSALIYNAAFYKPAEIGSEIAPHQDQALWKNTYPHAINIWIPLDDSTPQNGCIYGYQRSHFSELVHVREHEYIWHKFISKSSLINNPEYYPASIGDLLLWHRYFVHGSSRNYSANCRAALVFVFADSNLPDFKATDCYRLP